MESFLREGDLVSPTVYLMIDSFAETPPRIISTYHTLQVFSDFFERQLGVDLQGISGRTIAGDAHFFEDATTPAKVRAYLDSTKVLVIATTNM